MKKFVSVGEAGIILGVCATTMRRWEESETLVPNHRTVGNHRRYDLEKILEIIEKKKPDNRINICYSRVSSYDQKEDLIRQSQILMDFAKDEPNLRLIEDLGSGLNFNKKGLKTLIKLIIESKIDTIYITHKDRLLRFGSSLLINIAKEFGTKVIILDDHEQSFEEQLATDVLELMVVFSARLHGARSHKNKIVA